MTRTAYILGGGITGLAVANKLKEEFEVVVIEQEEYVGGLCHTRELNGASYEFGPHIVYWKSDAMKEFWKKFAPDWKAIDYIYRLSIDGKLERDSLYDFPISKNNVRRLLEQGYETQYPISTENNFETFMVQQIGADAYEKFIRGYNIKQWGIHPKDMSDEWAAFRPLKLREESPTRMFGDMPAGHPGSFKTTFEMLSDGIEIRKHHKVIGVTTLVNGSIDKILIEAPGLLLKGITRQFIDVDKEDVVVNTLPIDLFVDRKLEWRGVTKIFIPITGASPMPTYITTFPNTYEWTRIVDYNKHNGTEFQQLRLFPFKNVLSFAHPHSDNVFVFSDSMKGNACKFLDDLGVVYNRDNIQVESVFQCYPISHEKNFNTLNKIFKEVSQWNNFYTCGRLGLFAYISMSRAVEMAHEIADKIIEDGNSYPAEKLELYNNLRKELW